MEMQISTILETCRVVRKITLSKSTKYELCLSLHPFKLNHVKGKKHTSNNIIQIVIKDSNVIKK